MSRVLALLYIVVDRGQIIIEDLGHPRFNGLNSVSRNLVKHLDSVLIMQFSILESANRLVFMCNRNRAQLSGLINVNDRAE